MAMTLTICNNVDDASSCNHIYHLQAQVSQDQAFPLPALGKPELLRVVGEEPRLLVVQQVGQQVLQEQLQFLGGGASRQVCGKL